MKDNPRDWHCLLDVDSHIAIAELKLEFGDILRRKSKVEGVFLLLPIRRRVAFRKELALVINQPFRKAL